MLGVISLLVTAMLFFLESLWAASRVTLCRMVAAISPEPLPIYAPIEMVDILASLALRGRSRDGMGHPHGWGMLAFLRGQLVAYVRSLKPAWQAEFREGFRADLLLLHARRTSVGEVLIKNTHPFVRLHEGRLWGLAHNGTIERWEALVGDRRGDMLGDTDSEALLVYLSLAGSLRNAAAKLRELRSRIEELGLKSATNILTDGESLLASKATAEGENACTLYWTTRDWGGVESLVLSSEPIREWGDKWEEVPNWSSLLVEKARGGLLVEYV